MSKKVKLPNYIVDPFSVLTGRQKQVCREAETKANADLNKRHYLGPFALEIPEPLDYDFWEPESMTLRKKSKIEQKLQRNPKMNPPDKNLGRFIRPNGDRRQQRIAKEIKDRRVAPGRFDPWNESNELELTRPSSVGIFRKIIIIYIGFFVVTVPLITTLWTENGASL